MPTLLGADGKPLRSSRPSGAAAGTDLVAAVSGSMGRSQWTDRDPWGDGAGYLKSYTDIYRTQPVIAAVVDKITRRVATLPIGAFSESDDGSRDPLPRSHGLVTLLRRPVPGWSSTHLVAHITQSMMIHANALVAKVRTTGSDGPVDQLWPLDWQHIAAYAPDGGRIEWWSTTQFAGVERFLKASDVIHFAWPGPDGGEVGVSPLEKLGVTIRIEDAAQRHQTAMFREGNRPSLLISLDNPSVGQPAVEAAQKKVEHMHKGPDKAGRTLFFGAPVKAQPLSLTPVETELIEQRKLSREEVGMVYDLAGPLMNDLTHGTYSNVEELNRGLYRDVIPPWTTIIVETLEAQLVDLEADWMESVIRFDFTDKLRGAPQEQAEKLKVEVEAGLRTRDEARKELGLPPQGGKATTLTVNANNQAPLDAANPAPGPSVPPVEQ